VKRKILNCHKQTEGFGLPFLSIEGGKINGFVFDDKRSFLSDPGVYLPFVSDGNKAGPADQIHSGPDRRLESKPAKFIARGE
jgi:hypothetical protein